MNQTIGGGLSGGSAMRAVGIVATDTGAWAATLINLTVRVTGAQAGGNAGRAIGTAGTGLGTIRLGHGIRTRHLGSCRRACAG